MKQEIQPPAFSKSTALRAAGSGMTILEMSVVLLVLMALITLLFVGTKAWKRGSDRTVCILNIQAVQKGVRGFSNLYGFKPGDNVNALRTKIIGTEQFVGKSPVCPGNGVYDFGEQFGPDTIPPFGELYMQCTLGGIEEHRPTTHTDW